jgi:hypothetical protein
VTTLNRRGFDFVRAMLWALCGAVVIVFVFFAALGGVEPAEAQAMSIAVAVLAVLWLLHAWRRWSTDPDDLASRPDRERRGF